VGRQQSDLTREKRKKKDKKKKGERKKNKAKRVTSVIQRRKKIPRMN
jgi:hypothetical protein